MIEQPPTQADKRALTQRGKVEERRHDQREQRAEQTETSHAGVVQDGPRRTITPDHAKRVFGALTAEDARKREHDFIASSRPRKPLAPGRRRSNG